MSVAAAKSWADVVRTPPPAAQNCTALDPTSTPVLETKSETPRFVSLPSDKKHLYYRTGLSILNGDCQGCPRADCRVLVVAYSQLPAEDEPSLLVIQDLFQICHECWTELPRHCTTVGNCGWAQFDGLAVEVLSADATRGLLPPSTPLPKGRSLVLRRPTHVFF